MRARGQVLPAHEFNRLVAMQPGALSMRMSRDLKAVSEPRCDWQRYSAPLPQDPAYMVTYYHNK